MIVLCQLLFTSSSLLVSESHLFSCPLLHSRTHSLVLTQRLGHHSHAYSRLLVHSCGLRPSNRHLQNSSRSYQMSPVISTGFGIFRLRSGTSAEMAGTSPEVKVLRLHGLAVVTRGLTTSMRWRWGGGGGGSRCNRRHDGMHDNIHYIVHYILNQKGRNKESNE
jgi:hypothetical protein